MEKTEKELEQLLSESINTIIDEHLKLRDSFQYKELASILPVIKKANSIFLMGMGRSGLMMKAAAMRLMHLGFDAYVVGETTTPAIKEGDLLIAGTGSGTTSSVLRAADKAKNLGAQLICFTTDAGSPVAEKADYTVVIPAAQKEEHSGSVSKQYAGSLFEQALLLFFDALIQALWDLDGSTAEELYKRHSNLE